MSTTQTTEQEISALDEQIAGMEAELGSLEGHGRPLPWDEVTSTTAEEIAKKEQRRGILPRLITAAKAKRLELRIRHAAEELEGLSAERAGLYETLEKAKAAEQRARERR
jgi:predicted phage tail protein